METPEGKGKAIVDESINKINGAGIFANDHMFLLIIAKVESKYGEDPNTYRKGYDGGIFQVDEIGYKETKNEKSHPKLKDTFKSIKEKLNIDWPNTTWTDLRKPLYSALAARILLSTKAAAIPADREGQAKYWKEHYNKTGKGTAQKFLDDTKDDPAA